MEARIESINVEQVKGPYGNKFILTLLFSEGKRSALEITSHETSFRVGWLIKTFGEDIINKISFKGGQSHA